MKEMEKSKTKTVTPIELFNGSKIIYFRIYMLIPFPKEVIHELTKIIRRIKNELQFAKIKTDITYDLQDRIKKFSIIIGNVNETTAFDYVLYTTEECELTKRIKDEFNEFGSRIWVNLSFDHFVYVLKQ